MWAPFYLMWDTTQISSYPTILNSLEQKNKCYSAKVAGTPYLILSYTTLS